MSERNDKSAAMDVGRDSAFAGEGLGAMIGWAARAALPKAEAGSSLLATRVAAPSLSGLLPLGIDRIAPGEGALEESMFRRRAAGDLRAHPSSEAAPPPAAKGLVARSAAVRPSEGDRGETMSVPGVIAFHERARVPPASAPLTRDPAPIGGAIPWERSGEAPREMPLPSRGVTLRERPSGEAPSREMPLREVPLREMPLRAPGAAARSEMPLRAAEAGAAGAPARRGAFAEPALPERSGRAERQRSAAREMPLHEQAKEPERSEAKETALPPIVDGPQAAVRGAMRIGARVEEVVLVRVREEIRQREAERARATARDAERSDAAPRDVMSAPPRLDHAAIRAIAEELRAMDAEERFRSGLIR